MQINMFVCFCINLFICIYIYIYICIHTHKGTNYMEHYMIVFFAWVDLGELTPCVC